MSSEGWLVLQALQFSICTDLFDSLGNSNKCYYVHFVHRENKNQFGYKQTGGRDLLDITQLESSRTGF